MCFRQLSTQKNTTELVPGPIYCVFRFLLLAIFCTELISNENNVNMTRMFKRYKSFIVLRKEQL